MCSKESTKLLSEEAYRRLPAEFRDTPLLQLSAPELNGLEVYCKVESLLPSGSFKVRGAMNFCAALPMGSSFVCASAGNFGSAMALAAKKFSHSLRVFVPQNANPIKIERIRQYAAVVTCIGNDFDEAKVAAKLYANDQGLRFVEDGIESKITIGASCIGVELANSSIAFDQVIVPVGNGALINGIGSYLSSIGHPAEVIGVCAQGAPATINSWSNERIVSHPVNTIADGIAVREPIAESLVQMRQYTTQLIEVSDNDMLDAIVMAALELGIVLEPSGAASLAAISRYPELFKDRTPVVILCGAALATELWPEITKRIAERRVGEVIA